MVDVRYCLNCSTVGALDTHGRCATCNSDAVVLAESVAAWQPRSREEPGELRTRHEVLELEHLFKLTARAA